MSSLSSRVLLQADAPPLSEHDKKALLDGKLAIIFVVFFMTFAAEKVPWWLNRLDKAPMYISIGACFAAGVIMGAGFSHILPDAQDAWSEYFTDAGPVGLANASDVDYPFAELIGMAVFILLMTIDNILVRGGIEKKHDHGEKGHNHMVPQLPSMREDIEKTETEGSDKPSAKELEEYGAISLSVPGEPEERMVRGTREQVVQAYVFFVALSIHSIFDGLGIGAEQTMDGFYALLGAVLGHKLLDGFALGVPLFFANLPALHTYFALIFCALMTPLGVAIGIGATEAIDGTKGKLSEALILSMSFGSFVFISLSELLPAGLADGKHLWAKFGVLTFGWGVMVLIALWV